MNTKNISPSKRLASLDALRGFDLFLLVFFQPVFVAVAQQVDLPWLNCVLLQFEHAEWEGFRFWDLVMPLFLFMAGASMPFSFEKYRSDRVAAYRKVLRRFVILFFLGMIVQGNLLGLDPQHLYIYVNTLQAIACGYLIAAIILLHCKVRMQVIWTLLLLIVYAVPMQLFGDYSLEGNFANRIDAIVMGRFRGDPTYTWLWSSLTFGATVMFGALAGHIMKHGSSQRERTTLTLLVVGIVLVALAFVGSTWQPIIKRIWTSTMTLLAAGYSFLLMALFYGWIDCMGHSRGTAWLRIYGMNSITAYMIGECINFRSIVQSVSYGLQQYLSNYYDAWLTFGNLLIVFLILRLMYRHKVFLKI